MTLRERMNYILDVAKFVALAATIMAPIIMATVVGGWVLWGSAISETVREELGIVEMQRTLDELSGNDRIIKLDMAQSYVSEPTRYGEDVCLNLVVERTPRGSDFLLKGGKSLFTDARHVPLPGSTFVPSKQAGVLPSMRRLCFEHPPELETGRVTMVLALEYENMTTGLTEFDETPPIPFILLE